MQTSYSQDPVAGLPGQIANGRPHDIETRTANGVLTAGLYAVGDGTEKGAKHPDGAIDERLALGIVFLDPSNVFAEYEDKCPSAAIVRKGPVFVAYEPDTVPAPDSPVYARTTAAPGKPLGALRASAAETIQELDATVVTTADGAAFVLEVNGISLNWTSGASQNAAAKATAWAAHIDGIAGFTAAAVGALVTITTNSGAINVGDHSAASVFTYEIDETTGPTIAHLAPRAFWRAVDGEVGEIEID